MGLETNQWQLDNVTVIEVSGWITIGEGATRLRDVIQQALDDGRIHILLHLGEVFYIDSAGLGELIRSFSKVRKAGGALKLLKLTQRVQDLMQLTKLYTVFEVYDDEVTAMRSFASTATE